MLKKILKIIIQRYLKILIKIYLWRGAPEIILIAGTTNRFWIKEEIVARLREKFGDDNVRSNPKNFNAEMGLPLSMLNLASGRESIGEWFKVLWQGTKTALFDVQIPRYFALDAAFDAMGDIEYILSIIKPKIAIITNITPVYMENFNNLDEIKYELAKISQNLPRNGTLILNNDDARVKTLGVNTQAKIITYGVDNLADYQAINIQKNINGQTFEILNNNEKKEFTINRFGKHHIYAKMVGGAVARIMN